MYSASPPHVETIADERTLLFAERALFRPSESTLYIADLHLGKTAAFRANGIAIPQGTTAADLARLACLVAATKAERLVVLGDFIHAAPGRTPALDRAFRSFRSAHTALAVTLVRGNHDRRAGDPPEEWRVDVVVEPHDSPPFLLCHHPPSPGRGLEANLFGYTLCGHLHPGVRLRGPCLQTERLSCFVIGTNRAILPAFGGFTGLLEIEPGEGDSIVAIAGQRLFRVPLEQRAAQVKQRRAPAPRRP